MLPGCGLDPSGAVPGFGPAGDEGGTVPDADAGVGGCGEDADRVADEAVGGGWRDGQCADRVADEAVGGGWRDGQCADRVADEAVGRHGSGLCFDAEGVGADTEPGEGVGAGDGRRDLGEVFLGGCGGGGVVGAVAGGAGDGGPGDGLGAVGGGGGGGLGGGSEGDDGGGQGCGDGADVAGVVGFGVDGDGVEVERALDGGGGVFADVDLGERAVFGQAVEAGDPSGVFDGGVGVSEVVGGADAAVAVGGALLDEKFDADVLADGERVGRGPQVRAGGGLAESEPVGALQDDVRDVGGGGGADVGQGGHGGVLGGGLADHHAESGVAAGDAPAAVAGA